MALDIQTYDHDRDFDAIARIWNETRWIDKTDEHKKTLGYLLANGAAEVGLLAGEAECMVHRTPGEIYYENVALPLCAITAVTTSHIGRKQGFASAMTARAVRYGAESGAAVAVLGMFEQGFYDRFGFGTSSYAHIITFDPQSLKVAHIPYRTPVRLDESNAGEMWQTMSSRLKHHGAVTLESPDSIQLELGITENPFALGYRNPEGRLTHFILGSLKEENGPYRIQIIAFETTDQLMELLRLLRELGDQIHTVKLDEPAEVQLQALVDTPIRHRSRTKKSDHASGIEAIAWSQLRVLDMSACVQARRFEGEPVRFNLTLSDPIEKYLDDGTWHGITGDYTITIAESSTVGNGLTDGLPTLTCDVSAFSRLWFGVMPASSLRLTDEFNAPPELCTQLDRALRLPPVIHGLPF